MQVIAAETGMGSSRACGSRSARESSVLKVGYFRGCLGGGWVEAEECGLRVGEGNADGALESLVHLRQRVDGEPAHFGILAVNWSWRAADVAHVQRDVEVGAHIPIQVSGRPNCADGEDAGWLAHDAGLFDGLTDGGVGGLLVGVDDTCDGSPVAVV